MTYTASGSLVILRNVPGITVIILLQLTNVIRATGGTYVPCGFILSLVIRQQPRPLYGYRMMAY